MSSHLDLFFKVGNSKYKIGSKLFPVDHKSKVRIFVENNTEEILNQDLRGALDLCKFEEGRCYLNAEFVYELGKLLNLNIEYYAGWIFTGDTMPPIHHAWNVFEGGVIDCSLNILDIITLSEVDISNPNWREEVAPRLVENKKNPPSVTAVFGKVWSHLKYIGCPSTPYNARKIFRDLRVDFPKHPSYTQDGHNMYGKSKLQKAMEKYK